MTGEEQPQTTAPPARSLPLPVPLVPGADWRVEWCTACKAWSRLTGSIVLLTPDGVSTVGTWAWCEICDDPTDQPEARRG
ncbi:hypothetical protein ACGFR8_07985 [Streptomyces brevispora]|uniref:hypothetical protein n=1 Tax=Streptomyces brevispora TaxID=887462 RepID=UPI00371F01EC